ncbi:MAG: hypothetical protein EPO51_14945 [Phenylobacterium sp.]|uniref:hypothetical protein n=1 Tax=Phenylobacterium sp. TaxID=1871053 RepID=UPI00122321ED|nr:hypothetical protein [Phenylobacterium sp.]TAJ71073.1 MAG: hypothetical protein EPO51_14945 [Phenylobacterium sp.]
MRNKNLLLAAAAALTLGASAASAQAWMPIIERQAVLNDRIDAGLATGEITGAEARMMRDDMASLVALEGTYRYGGLSARERLDLDRRFALIDDQMRLAVRTGGADSYVAMEDRKLDLDARIEQGLRSGQLTTAEAEVLRDDFNEIARIEASYRVDGLSAEERADLNRRFDELGAAIRVARADPDRTYGWNRY